MQRFNANFAVILLAFTIITIGACAGPAESAEGPTIERDDQAVHIDLGNGTRLGFALDGDMLLGLNTAEVNGRPVTSSDTVQRPILAQEFDEDRHIFQSFRFEDASVEDGRVVIRAQLMANTDEQSYRNAFVFMGDPDRVKEEGMTPELEQLYDAANEAEQVVMERVNARDDIRERREALEQYKEEFEKTSEQDDEVRYWQLSREVFQGRRQLNNRIEQAKQELLEEEDDLAEQKAAIDAWNEALDEVVHDYGVIHRDYYDFAILRQPADVATLDKTREVADRDSANGGEGGWIEWVIEPHTENVAGWPWIGWKQHFRFELADGRKVNHINVLGTWELDGEAVGSTPVAMRYRGLGGIEDPVEQADGGGALNGFSTTEVIPGAVGDAPLVSPVVADPAEHDRSDRDWALRHRVNAWIAQMARGAGAPFVDFQYRDGAAFAGYPVKQGNLRAVTEIMPGDQTISQTDREYFAMTDSHETIPMIYGMVAAEQGDAPFDTHELRNRWQELDQHVRDMVSEELGFVQDEPLPGAHWMLDHNFHGQKQSIANNIEELAELGMRRIETHHPGWINGRVKNPDTPDVGGGVNDIYDFYPLDNVKDPWREMTRRSAEHDIEYHIWLGGMVLHGGMMFREIGSDLEYWSFNKPDPESLHDDTGYRLNNNFNIHHPHTREVLLNRLDEVRERYGYHGFWVDSYQNLLMSQLDWPYGDGDSIQRAWWEQIAAWSRDGMSWTAESHSFPGMSCTIEVESDWEDAWWFAQHVQRAFRAGTFPDRGGDGADRVAFRFMANKGWATPDLRGGQLPTGDMPSFKRLAHEYLEALPLMRRSWILPGEGGVLWLGYDGDGEGVWFSFSDQDVPAGVEAVYIRDEEGEAVDQAEAHHTYRVTADDLIEAFDLRRGPLDDDRLGREYTPREPSFPEWTRQ